VAEPQKAQQGEWRRSSEAELKRRAEEHYGKRVPEEACLLELGWYMKEVIVTYVQCKRCGEKGYHAEENKRQDNQGQTEIVWVLRL